MITTQLVVCRRVQVMLLSWHIPAKNYAIFIRDFAGRQAGRSLQDFSPWRKEHPGFEAMFVKGSTLHGHTADLFADLKENVALILAQSECFRNTASKLPETISQSISQSNNKATAGGCLDTGVFACVGRCRCVDISFFPSAEMIKV